MPNREIRERIRTSEKVSALTDSEFRLFVLLITCADDYGRFHGDPRLVRSACYPFDSHSLSSVSRCLASVGQKEMVQLYERDGKAYLQINQWKQRIRAKDSKFPDPPMDDCRADDGQTTGTRARITNNDIRITNNGNGGDDAGFDRFWTVYPNKKGKQAALKAWNKHRCDGFVDKIVDAIEKQKTSKQWLKDAGQFIPHPATWLNRGQWDDEIESLRLHPVTGKPQYD